MLKEADETAMTHRDRNDEVTSLWADRNIYYETRNLLTECHDKTYYVRWLSSVMSSCIVIVATLSAAVWWRIH